MNWALQNRLRRLQTEGGNFVLLALDHPMTFGVLPGLEDINQWIDFVTQSSVSGLVINPGELRRLRTPTTKGVIVQLMGFPSRRKNEKVPISSVAAALAAGADGVALQLAFGEAESSGEALTAALDLVSTANVLHFPTLLMVLGGDQVIAEDYDSADMIRIAAQLPIDMIKIGLPEDELPRSARLRLRSAIEAGPPVVLAGGKATTSFRAKLMVAKELGFTGVCVGRNVFQHDKPETVVEMVREVFP